MTLAPGGSPPFRKLLVANRSEIAIRVFRAATELGIRTVAVYADEDALSLHRFKADEAYRLDAPGGPIAPYLSIDRILEVAVAAGVDAIHPGYGFLAENPEFAEACAAAGIVFIGPTPATMRELGDKVAARRLAMAVDVPVVPATPPLPDDPEDVRRLAAEIGFPAMLKASWGGGGRGMRVIREGADLLSAVQAGRREAKAAFGRDDVYLERFIGRARHVEVQLLGDHHGGLVHLFERDCSIQRRNQKVVERAPAPYLPDETRRALCEAALRIGRATAYRGAGTVEFLLDEADGAFYFIEVNPRIQVEHTVTEMVTGVDIVKAQIQIAAGGRIGRVAETGVTRQEDLRLNGHAIQCRITTEDPENNFVPDHGRITGYRGAFGYGVRIDGGNAYTGAIVTRHYDPLLEKITCWAPAVDEVIARTLRALREYRIRGVATNLAFLENVVSHPVFAANAYTTRFVDETPELVGPPPRQDRATRLLRYIAEVTVNGHPETLERARPPASARVPRAPEFTSPLRPVARQVLETEGPRGLAAWMRGKDRLLVCDTTMRDAHQSLLATRLRTWDIANAAEAYGRGLPELLSIECWGGATFDVAMRFLQEDPWERLALIRQRAPNLLTQMLLRGANAVGYANYPDNVVRHFIQQAASAGIDIFRIFDCFNWVENMRVAIDTVVESGKVAEGTVCYTGDILDPDRTKYALNYYVDLAQRLSSAGCHVLAIKDMAGLLKPAAARVLIRALRDATDLPLRLHTHDTSGAAAATLIAAAEAGIDAIDAAIDAMSGGTSQPCLGSVVEALRRTDRDTGLDPAAIRRVSVYWEGVRRQYAAFESDQKAGASEVYLHEMPGGQFTNLKEQARSVGLEGRWDEVARAYRDANLLFGDIIKVTPSSKVVGDMALMMVAQGLSASDVLDEGREIAFPASVVEMLRGDLGQPPGGWPPALQRRVLKAQPAITCRPAALLEPVDLDAARAELAALTRHPVGETELASWLMYPKVFLAFQEAARKYGPVSKLPTPVFFYGMSAGQEISVDIETGKAIVIRLVAIGNLDEDGHIPVFFELNGQPRLVTVADRRMSGKVQQRRRAEPKDGGHVGAPMPGVVTTVAVAPGQTVEAGDLLFTIEAMKMETTVSAPRAGKIDEVVVSQGRAIEAGDLLLTLA